MSDIVVDEADGALYASIPSGIVPDDWFPKRLLTSATLSGRYVDVAHSESVAALWGHFAIPATVEGGLEDFDGSAVQNAGARALTQKISAHLYALTEGEWEPSINGIRFLSRFGADLELWTVFEQPTDADRSDQLSDIEVASFGPHHPVVRNAFRLLNLTMDG
ncbi:hypothetical protein JG551_000098 [Curtobacterium flaccumfaciens pv. flaccumfaciens]|uniref:hypothetical protein n=1 Tax=Curtobacterium flaccumfaciens TaxID=2035 RepID=UPI001BCD084B|nr:hypothetical protein [Curtobacterium flaccumfaciens]QVG66227.1 hypothetical protein JG551_000098 [Curtobacterium flaccumfaciens pv. flaccumfaciens]